MNAKKKQEIVQKYQLHDTQSVEDTVKIVKEYAPAKFTESIDIDIMLNLKEKQKKESVRGSVDLPHSFGEEKKVIVFTHDAKEKEALDAGASAAGLDALKEKVLNGDVEFDVVIATPDVMAKIIELGKVLGPKGLMPNPKNGTVTEDIATAVQSFRKGKMNFKMQQGQGVVRGKIGQVDMSEEAIKENLLSYVRAVASEARKLNQQPFKKIIVSSTMGPSIHVDVQDLTNNL